MDIMDIIKAKLFGKGGGSGANLGYLDALENGIYQARDDDLDGYSMVTVDVHEAPALESLLVLANGEYYPPDGVDGFNSVSVSVQTGAVPQDYTMVTFSAQTVGGTMQLVSCSNSDDVFAASGNQTPADFLSQRIDAGHSALDVMGSLYAIASMNGQAKPVHIPLQALSESELTGGFIPLNGTDPYTSAATVLFTVSDGLGVAIANIKLGGTEIQQNVAATVIGTATNATLTLIGPAVYEEPEQEPDE